MPAARVEPNLDVQDEVVDDVATTMTPKTSPRKPLYPALSVFYLVLA